MARSSFAGRMSAVLLLLLVIVTSLPSPQVAAQDASPSAEPPIEIPSSTATPEPTATSTAMPTATATPQPSATPTSTAVAPISFDPTATPSPTISNTNANTNTNQSATLTTGAQVIVHLGDAAGPVLSGICASLYGRDHHDWNSTDCSNSGGELSLPVLIPAFGPKQYLIEVENTAGYTMPPGQEFVATLPFGTVNTYNIWVVAQPTGTETLLTRDALTGDPVGGACWTYLHNQTTVIGPVCDTDNDGTVVVPDIVADSYCLVTTAPSGYDLVGSEPICAANQVRNGTYTKLVISQSSPSAASLHISATAPWGVPQADICVKISGTVGGSPIEFSAGCTDSTGQLTITGLVPGQYTLSDQGLPAAFNPWTTITVTAVAGTNEQTIPLTIRPAGDVVLTSVLYYGPQTLSGACYSYTTNLNGKPGPQTVLGPVCDTDGDGVTTIAGVPSGSFCFALVLPPPGYTRDLTNASYCDTAMRGGKTSIGFSPIPTATPKPATPTRTNTPRPTATPFPTATTIPSPPPSGNEPNAGLLFKNCGYYESGTDPYYGECVAAPAGIKIQVIQNGGVVQTITTGSGGSGTVNLPNRAPYTLHYLSGNGTWVSGVDEEARVRYDSTDIFYFQPNPATPHLWNLTVTTNVSPANNPTPIGGVCAKIVGHDGVTYVAERCDTDNDGSIDFGQLPARYYALDLSFYSAVMTVAPAGLPLRTDPSIGSVSGVPTTSWSAGWTYLGAHQILVRTEDPSGNLVTGGCYRFSYTTSTGTTAWDYITDYQGITQDSPYDFISTGSTLTITPRCLIAGYTVPTTPQTITLPSTFQTTVTFVVQPYGSMTQDTASVRIMLGSWKYHDNATIIRPSFTSSNTSQFCITLHPGVGNPSGGACVDGYRTREAIIRNLPVGTYTIDEALNTSGCTGHTPGQTFDIANSDLGTEKQVIYFVECASDNDSCTSYTTPPGRSVDVWYGTLYDAQNNPVGTKLYLSESVPATLVQNLFQQAVPDSAIVTGAALAQWQIPFSPNSSATAWDLLPDYDTNPQQLLTTAWLGTANAVVDQPVNRGTLQATGSISSTFLFGPLSPEEKAMYPECADLSAFGFGTILVDHQTSVHFYRLDAHIVPPSATATATATSTPSATAIPSPAAVCSSTISRDLTAYYGVLRDENGHVISNNLALSDHIPAALSDAIRSASSPGQVNSLIAHWIDTGRVEQNWAAELGDNLDPATGLVDLYGTQSTDIELGAPQDLGSQTYTFTTYILVDSNSVPAGCVLPADYESAALGLLIPVEQTTSVTIHFTGQDAIARGQILPTATSTATDEASPTVAVTSTATTPVEPTTTAAPSTTVAPGTTVPQPSATTGVTTLPNTGAYPSQPENGHLWLMLFALLISLLGTLTTLHLRRQ